MNIPNAPMAEQAALGCAIADPTWVGELREAWFFDERHRAILAALSSLAADGRPIDEVSVQMRVGPVLGHVVDACVAACVSPAQFPVWREELAIKARLRAAWQYHGTARARIEALPAGASSEEESELLSTLEAEFTALGSDSTIAEDVGAAEAIDDLFSELEAGAEATTLTTGLQGLDSILRLRPGQMVVIAARPSVGKSSLAGRILEHITLERGKPAGMFSLEMSRSEVVRRMASSLSGVPFADFEHPSEDQQPRMVDALGRIKWAPLRVCDKGGLRFSQLAGIARRWKVRHKIEAIVVDYLGLLTADGKQKSRYEAVTEISQQMKALARELQVVVFCLAQLNRQAAGSDGSDDRPRMHQLRDSGSIEQDADAVILLHATGCTGHDRQVVALLEKQRNGPLGEAQLRLHGPTMRFESVSPVDWRDIPQ